MLIRTVAPDTAPIDLTAARRQCRAPENGDDDAEVERALHAAIGYAERITGLALAPSTYEARFLTWPCYGRWVDIGIAPVRDVLSITYRDSDGVQQAVDRADWTWEPTPEGARVRFLTSYSFPALSEDHDHAVIVTVRAGYDNPDADFDTPELQSDGDPDDTDVDPGDSLELPPGLVSAVMLLTEHYYDRAAGPELKTSADNLLALAKIYR